jgi:MoxR-like ATPase
MSPTARFGDDPSAAGVLQRPPQKEPFYRPVGDEIALFEAAARHRLPILLAGPTGCGKTRFVQHMAWRLGRPLVTVACHDDLSATDLTGRWLVRAGATVWHARTPSSSCIRSPTTAGCCPSTRRASWWRRIPTSSS